MANQVMLDPYGRSEDERKSLREKIDRLNRYAYENWTNPEWRREMAQEMTEKRKRARRTTFETAPSEPTSPIGPAWNIIGGLRSPPVV